MIKFLCFEGEQLERFDTTISVYRGLAARVM